MLLELKSWQQTHPQVWVVTIKVDIIAVKHPKVLETLLIDQIIKRKDLKSRETSLSMSTSMRITNFVNKRKNS
jgi:hypothetical protein